MNSLVVCLNMDTVKNKNVYQFEALRHYGFRYLACGYEAGQTFDASGAYEYCVYPRDMTSRMLFVYKLLLAHRQNIHHVELYTGGGSFLAYEFLLAKMLRLKTCVVERGSPLLDLDGRYTILARGIRKAIYRRADIVWIRELWMKSALARIGRSNYFFLPNAIKLPESHVHSATKPIDFVWCNSLKKWRNPDWFVEGLCEPELAHASAVMLGFLDGNPTVGLQQDDVRRHARMGIQLLPFQPPEQYFLRSRFFVLPSDIVYLNFALLEAMAHGVVPIVSDVEGARDIVIDGESGLVCEHSPSGLVTAMRAALKLSPASYERMSRNARKRVKEKFSVESWAEALSECYGRLSAQ